VPHATCVSKRPIWLPGAVWRRIGQPQPDPPDGGLFVLTASIALRPSTAYAITSPPLPPSPNRMVCRQLSDPVALAVAGGVTVSAPSPQHHHHDFDYENGSPEFAS
jgi:hypothetical protein